MTDLLLPTPRHAPGAARLRAPRRSPARDGVAMALVAMTSVQLGLALSVGLIDAIGVVGAAWLRLSVAALVLLAMVRPQRLHFPQGALRTTVALGIATAGVSLLFMAAVARLPLGTATALEFLGALGVAALRSRGPARLLPLLALAGVVLLTEPWSGTVDLVGVGFALGSAVCVAAYILLTQRASDAVEGLSALALSLTVAALLTTVVTLAVSPAAFGAAGDVLVLGVAAALLLPLVPFALEMLALRRLTTAAFGTLMALEPAIALLVGMLALGQVPSPLAVVGMGLVVAAGVGATRTGARV